MIYCFDEDRSFVNYLFEKDNIPYVVSESPTDTVVILHTPYPWVSSWVDRVNKLLKQQPQRVIVFVTELHTATYEWIVEHPEFDYYINGSVNGVEHRVFMDWFAITRDFYKTRTHLLEPLFNTPVPERLRVNALLGRKKAHRDIVYSRLLDNSSVLMTYMNTQHRITDSVKDPAQFIWEGTPQPVNWTIDRVDYDGEQVSISQVVPISVYQQTDWCLVAETNYQPGFVFFTEKIAKPMLAKRPFILAGNPGSLRLLHQLGFKTFGSVVNEDYDLESDFVTRMNRVSDLVEYLTQLDPGHIEDMHLKVKSIVEHNYQVLMQTDWQSTQLNELGKMVI